MDFYSLLKHHSAKIGGTCCFQLPREKRMKIMTLEIWLLIRQEGNSTTDGDLAFKTLCVQRNNTKHQ